LRIIVNGLIAQHPTLGGVAWDYLQYPVGLHRLGHDVYYVEDSGQWPYEIEKDLFIDRVAQECAPNVRHLASTMRRFGLEERWAYRFPRTGEWFGLSDIRRNEVMRTADLVLNVSGSLARPRKYHGVARLAYIDTDPVFTQVRLARADRKFTAQVLAHDVCFSFGEAHSTAVPATDQFWRPTRQPILLSEWNVVRGFRKAFTTVMSWMSYKPLVYAGKRYGQKDVQFKKYLDLPRNAPSAVFEVAINDHVHTEWRSDETIADTGRASISVGEILKRAGWRIASAREVAGDLDSYRSYIETSMAEWSVSKHGYVVGQPAWFSCRSACYLAAGRPVVVENTGIDRTLPVGQGILSFSDLDSAVAAVEEVSANYDRHASAAHDISRTWFDSDRVLEALVAEAMSAESPPRPRIAAREWCPKTQ
jgi:hypothetical protein